MGIAHAVGEISQSTMMLSGLTAKDALDDLRFHKSVSFFLYIYVHKIVIMFKTLPPTLRFVVYRGYNLQIYMVSYIFKLIYR